MELDADLRILRGPAGEVPLQLRDVELMAVFLANPGKLIARERMALIVWGAWSGHDPRSLSVYVTRLRAKMRAVGATYVIRCVYGSGWVLTAA